MKKLIILILLIVFLCVSVAGAFYYYGLASCNECIDEDSIYSDIDNKKYLLPENESLDQYLKAFLLTYNPEFETNYNQFILKRIGNNNTGINFSQELVESRIESKESFKIIICTAKLEGTYESDEVLMMYLNTSTFGGVQGIQNASEFYFNKAVENLNMVEKLLLISMLGNENMASSDLLVEKANYIINEAYSYGYISETEKKRLDIELSEFDASILIRMDEQ